MIKIRYKSEGFASRIIFLMLSAMAFIVFLYPFWAPAQEQTLDSRSALLFISASIVLILLALFGEAQTTLSPHAIAMIGTLLGLNAILRLIETVIPLPGGFSPIFILIVFVGHSFGARLGFIMGALTMLVTGPFTAGGIGPWTPYQMLAAGWVGLGAASLPKKNFVLPALILYSTLWGWLYGALTNLYFWPYALSAPDIGWERGLSFLETLLRYGRYYLVSSLLWDSARAIGNFLLMLLIGPSLLKVFDRFRLRTHITWETA